MHFRSVVTMLTAVALLVPLTGASPAPSTPAPRSVANRQVAAAASSVTANFAQNLGKGHREVFGANINHLDQPAKLDAFHQNGANFVRRTAYLFQIVPETTPANYRANVGGVADPANWHWELYGWGDEYAKRGIELMLIMGYGVPWLGHGCANCEYFSPPRPENWDIYEDIVKKVYQHFAGKVKMVELWNEPNTDFLRIGGSSYPDNLTAYRDIYFHAAKAIRSVDTQIPLGGPALSAPATNWIQPLLSDARIAPNINFLSYHHYDTAAVEAVEEWKAVAQQNGKGADFPVYVSEWNWTAAYNYDPMNVDHPNMISTVGHRLSTFYKQRANGTNYFSDNDEGQEDWGVHFGVYKNGTLTPKQRTFRLLGQDLGLAAGDSTIRGISYGGPVTNAGAATNSAGENVAWVVNDGTAPIEVDLALTGLGSATSAVASIFEASTDQAIPSPKASIPLTIAGGNSRVRFQAPAKSVLGVRLTPYSIADTENLAPAATVTGSSSSDGLVPANVTDGIESVHAVGEWASNSELTPWVQLAWPAAQTVSRVVLADRANPTDQIKAGWLVFSDGSSVPVPPLPNDGSPKVISFPSRTTTWVRLQVTTGIGLNVGLSELQVHRGGNVAPAGVLTSSTPTGVVRAVDGVIGSDWVATTQSPWLQVDWVHNRTIDEITLYDRADATSNVNGGTLTFSDGSSVPVTGIPADGKAKVVTFAARSVAWVRFQASGSTGTGIGLSEVQIRPVGNVASSATATASSEAADTPQTNASAAIDGVINQWHTGEWGSNFELNPWLRLNWAYPQKVTQVVLYDRNNLIDKANGGTLTFSDGSSIKVTGLDNSGLGKIVTFAPKSITWVRFQVEGGDGWAIGLSELEVS